MKLLPVLALLMLPAAAEELVLPRPHSEGGKPLMQALKARPLSREFRAEKLPAQVLSNLLRAAAGVNRAESGKRTAPGASKRQEIDIYAAPADGRYLFNPKAHGLDPVLSGNLRGATGTQAFVRDTPANVCLIRACEGPARVVRGSVDRAALAKAVRLRPEQHLVPAQTAGYPE